MVSVHDRGDLLSVTAAARHLSVTAAARHLFDLLGDELSSGRFCGLKTQMVMMV